MILTTLLLRIVVTFTSLYQFNFFNKCVNTNFQVAYLQILRFSCVFYLFRVSMFSSTVTLRCLLPVLNVAQFTTYLGVYCIIKIATTFINYLVRLL